MPIERYETPDRVQVHIFARGKARVVVANALGGDALKQDYFPENSSVAAIAAAITRVNDLFTKAELDEMDRRERARKNKFFWGGESGDDYIN